MTAAPNSALLKQSVQRAMIGEVTSNLAGVKARLEEPAKVVIDAFFFSEPSEQDLEHFDDIGTYVTADFPTPFTIETHVAKLVSPIPRSIDSWLYLRAEAMQQTDQERKPCP